MGVEISAMIAADDCYRCGYDLRGIEDEQPCPECGLLARRSRRESDELHATRPRWLARISRGTNLILLAPFAPFVWAHVMSVVVSQFPTPLWMTTNAWTFVLQYVGLDVSALLLLAGAWLLTTPEGYAPADRADRRLRLALRAWAFVPILSMLARSFVGFMQFRAAIGGQPRGWLDLLNDAVEVFATVGLAPLPFLLFMQLRGLARRARSAHLAEHCTIVGIGTAAAFVYAGLVTLMSEHAEALGLGSNWRTGSKVSLWLMVLTSTAAILFTLWSLYLFVRFAVAFRRAARALRGKWRSDDRAARVIELAEKTS